MVLECVCCRVMSVNMLQECRARQSSVVSVMRGCLVGWAGGGGVGWQKGGGVSREGAGGQEGAGWAGRGSACDVKPPVPTVVPFSEVLQ